MDAISPERLRHWFPGPALLRRRCIVLGRGMHALEIAIERTDSISWHTPLRRPSSTADGGGSVSTTRGRTPRPRRFIDRGENNVAVAAT